ncbi:MAG: NifB/NifX family molybdenum-iron cluster-binding protein [bacterium]
MKIAISTGDKQVYPHFGRCPTFTIAEVENGKVLDVQEINNPGHSPGFLPKFLSERGVSVIIAGGMGHRAKQLFDNYNIQSVVGVSGSVQSAIEQFASGSLDGGESMCEHPDGQHNNSGDCQERQQGKIIVSSTGADLDSEMDPRFGRAPYFLIYDLETDQYESIENSSVQYAQGAGSSASQLVANKGVKGVIAGNFGPNAANALNSFNIKMYVSPGGKISEIIKKFKSGEIKPIDNPTVAGHHGQN